MNCNQELFTSQAPYHYYRTDGKVITSLIKGELPIRPDPDAGIEDDLWDLCGKCWHENPELRPSMRTITKELWDQDLKCKLRSRRRRRRRESDSPERSDTTSTSASTNSGTTDSDQQSTTVFEGRLRKSPRLSYAELGEDLVPLSPGTPIAMSRALVRTPTPRTASTSSSSSSNASSRFSSQRSSGGNLADPRHLFTAHSEGDLYSTMYGYHHQNQMHRARPSRGYTEPTTPSQQHFVHDGMGLGLHTGALQSPQFDFRLDDSLALMSPRGNDPYGSMLDTPRQAAFPLEDMHHVGHPHLYPHMAAESGPEGYLDASLIHSVLCPQTYYVPHPSQWSSFHNPFAHTPPSPSQYARFRHDRTASLGSYHTAGYMTPPSRQIASPGMQSSPSIGYSPLQTPMPLHAIGPVFSETFTGNYVFDDPLTYSPPSYHASPNLHQDPSYIRGSGQPAVDFTSLQQGTLSPAFSDINASPQPAHRSFQPPAPIESPLVSDLDSFDDPDGALLGGLALFGGIDDGTGAPVVPEHPTFYANAPEELTPHGSPQLLARTLPLTRSPQSGGPGGLHPQLPLTPRISPLLSEF